MFVAPVVPFTALVGYGLWSQYRTDQATVAQQAVAEARVLAGQLDDHIGNLENLLAGLSEAVSTDPRDVDANDALLRTVSARQPAFVAHINLFTTDGTNIGTSSDPAAWRPKPTERRYFLQVLAGQRLSIGEVFNGKGTGRWLIDIASPVEDKVGHLRGVLAVGTWLEQLPDALRMQALPPNSIVTVVSDAGIVIARSVDAESWIGRDTNNWKNSQAFHTSDCGAALLNWSLSDKVSRVTTFASAHRVPWRVVVGIPTDEAFASVLKRLGWSGVFIAVTLLGGFGIAWYLSGRLVGPLRQLGRDASRLASGELNHRSSVHSRDEIGTLAEDFNRMAFALERRADEARAAADEVRQTKDTLAAVIDASPVAIVCCDLDRKIVLWNRTAEKMFGYTAEEALDQPTKLVPSDANEESKGLFERAVGGETLRNVELKRLHKDGSLIQVRVAAAPMYNLDGSVRGVARAYEDVSDSKRAEEQLRRLAHYDPLTGLPNRLSLQKDLGRLLAGCQVSPVAIALFDLDGFKDVNDTLGHSTGDQLLVEVCERFSEVIDGLGRVAKVCRLGGDEFVVIIPDCGDPVVVGSIVTSILTRLTEPFEVNGNVLHLGSSAGIAIAPTDATHADDLISNADLALYQAKAAGGRTYRLFLPVLRAQAQARRGMGIELRRAFAENEFELHYQPQLRLADGAVMGAEALLRWRHPTRGLVLPGAFIEQLAESAIAPEVGRWIIGTACAQLAAWHRQGLMLGRVAVNLFPAQAHSPALAQDVDDVLRQSGLPPGALELEITENVALNRDDPSTPLHRVFEMGVKLAFDDFGTGYAALNCLTRFPVWRIKIDRSFVSRIAESSGDGAIVRSLVAMAHNLGLRVIAEGVETEQQAALLAKEECEEAQGYLYAQPLPAAAFEDYLRMHRLETAGGDLIERNPPRRRAVAANASRSMVRRKLHRQ